MTEIILASGSRYRKRLLERLHLHFSQTAPNVDETPLAGEAAEQLALRLARAKAAAVGRRHPGAIVIGSDQVALLGDQLLGKPGTVTRAQEQLRRSSGRAVDFYTALCLYRDGEEQTAVVPFRVQFRSLRKTDICRYVELEQPLDCAGSFKCEGLGSALFESLSGADPTALEGLPLIALTGLLRNWGVDPLEIEA